MWYFAVLTIIIAYLAVYCIIPNIWLRSYSKSVLRYVNRDVLKVSLTFDDGPNPEYTPQILGILKNYGVKATFFLVGKNALLYPDIVKTIQDDGHTIGTHSFSHIHAWLMLPGAIFKDFTKSCSAIKKITCEQPLWYRPPWGTFNLIVPFTAKKFGLTTVYWSVSAHDWKAYTSPENIANTVITKVKPGAIIVLHDNGDNHYAPQKTADALPMIISSLKHQGYKFVTLNESGGI
jgi:peptidoglycan/xylan/chitin deacetylase (PgdA/CDA1 family)